MKKTFYTYIEGQDEEPTYTLAYDAESAAIERVGKFDRDTAGERDIAEGAIVTCHVFTSNQFHDTAILMGEYSSNWLDFEHSTFRVSGEFDVVYYIVEEME